MKRAANILSNTHYTKENAPAIVALVEFASQNPGLDWRNYYSTHADKTGIAAYTSEQRSIARQFAAFKVALYQASSLNVTDQEVIEAAKHAFSGRLTWYDCKGTEDNYGWSYCAGQYFPTEYRAAATAVLEAAINNKRRANPQTPDTVPDRMTVAQMKEISKNAGNHFFDASSMRFFRSKIHGEPRKHGNLYYFITSEQYNDEAQRKYTLRAFDPLTGDTPHQQGEEWEFQAHPTLEAARHALKLQITRKDQPQQANAA